MVKVGNDQEMILVMITTLGRYDSIRPLNLAPVLILGHSASLPMNLEKLSLHS